ncbi:CYTH and CHAD domain-containing protein [Polaromonas sp. SM01]|uniref:CYTH and CHAD domain-containing protein n=1 Tax=Polaromonas sp. SM01 TaxID=3085630 RepID=UPI002981937B|nr:CYTH and CHAD domain-containing protein [Polaromonas sp. SM01]MDW5444468.1 CYTH and CHAD domain-containing protein [Polaromonas sp. SM01]
MEIELKLQLPPSALAALRADPLLARLPSTRQQLENLYFDTAQRTLAQAGISLRLRSDGQHWLQTIKGRGSSQAGLYQREEIEFVVAGPALEWLPLAGTSFEPTLKALRDPLLPQFHTRFERHRQLLCGATGAKIELAIDQGEILAGDRREPLCELELELLDGPVDDVFSLALLLVERHPLVLGHLSKAERGSRLAQGTQQIFLVLKTNTPTPSPGADAQTVARLAIAQSLAHWQANEAGFLRPPDHHKPYDSEYLHQIRVAVRRLRVACGPLARAAKWNAEALAPVRDGLGTLGQRLGAARDWDVFIEETWPALVDGLHDAALRQKLQEAADLLQGTAHLQASAALQGRETQRLLLQLGRRLAQPDAAAALPTDALTARLEKLAHLLRQALGKLEHLSPARLHRLRIAAKQLRYLTEFTGHQYNPQAADLWLEWLKKAQAVLGARNDRVAAQTQLKALCASLNRPSEKIHRQLQSALQKQPLPELALPSLPDPYWR